MLLSFCTAILRARAAFLVCPLLLFFPAVGASQLRDGSTAATRGGRSTAWIEHVIDRARRQMGTRYVWGGESPETGFDCSGFIRYVFAGVRLPRTSAEQAQVGREVPRDLSALRAGDLLTFGRGGRISHIGMYVGRGRYIHASSRAGAVTESAVPQREWWQGVRRVVPSGGAGAVSYRSPVPRASGAVSRPARPAEATTEDGSTGRREQWSQGRREPMDGRDEGRRAMRSSRSPGAMRSHRSLMGAEREAAPGGRVEESSGRGT